MRSADLNKVKSGPQSGGYVWHTTGSGKTLTSFKAARLATQLDFVDKVFFVVDRKDLDYQTMKEYQRFQPDSVNGSIDTRALRDNLEKQDNKIVVTTLQKLNILLKKESALPIYRKHCVFIFDECHRSQFGEAQKNLQKRFSHYYQFGFTGTSSPKMPSKRERPRQPCLVRSSTATKSPMPSATTRCSSSKWTTMRCAQCQCSSLLAMR